MASEGQSRIETFEHVDRAADPAASVRYLDALRSMPAAQQYKQMSFHLLEVREGARLLDVGCGSGDDVRALAALVGESGRVVGIDSSERMIEEARARDGRDGVPAAGAGTGRAARVEFHVMDAHQLGFPDADFDGCRADRVLQHVADPARVLGDLVRVARPGGRIVVVEPDWETFVIDATDRQVTRRVLNHRCDDVRHGWIGRQLPGLFHAAGLADIAVQPITLTSTSFAEIEHLGRLSTAVEHAVAAGSISPEAGDAWLAALRQRDAAGRFFSAITGFVVAGRKP